MLILTTSWVIYKTGLKGIVDKIAPSQWSNDLNQLVNQLTQFAERQIQQSITQNSVAPDSIAVKATTKRKASKSKTSSKIKEALKI